MANPAPTPSIVSAEPLAPPSAEDLAVLEPPESRRWRWVGAAVGVGALLIAMLALFRGGGDDGYDTVALSSGRLVQRVTAVGQLEPVDHVEIGSDLTGQLVEVLVDENDTVAAGAVLARLDPEPFDNAVTQRRASTASAWATARKASVDLERAQQDLARTKRLYDRGAATEVALSEARLTVEAAQAQVDATRASHRQAAALLERAQNDLRDTVIVSPIDGVVIRRMVDEGQTVVSSMSATPLFEVASDLGALMVEVEVDEADVGLVAPDQPARFTVAAWPDRTFDATVVTVDLAASAASSVVVYGTELHVDNTDGALRPGMTATAEIQVGEVADALLVPTVALRYRPIGIDAPSGDHLWTLDDSELVAVPVRLGGSDGATTAVYGEGLRDGLDVVIGGGR